MKLFFIFFVELYSQDPVRSAIVDSCIRVMDNGRESINRKVSAFFSLFFIFIFNAFDLIMCLNRCWWWYAHEAHSLC